MQQVNNKFLNYGQNTLKRSYKKGNIISHLLGSYNNMNIEHTDLNRNCNIFIIYLLHCIYLQITYAT